MADDKEKNEELEVDDSSGKKKKMIIIIALVVVLAGGGGAFFFMSGGEPAAQVEMAEGEMATESGDGESADGEEAEAMSDSNVGTALYVPMPRPFRFNAPGSARDRFVEIRVQLLVRGAENEENAKKHIPLLESTLLTIFSQANADDLSSSAGKDALKQQSLTGVQQIMKEVAGGKTVEKVLFTGFVMQ